MLTVSESFKGGGGGDPGRAGGGGPGAFPEHLHSRRAGDAGVRTPRGERGGTEGQRFLHRRQLHGAKP
eukprot:8997375-Pyramimonas_sp.AAC.1